VDVHDGTFVKPTVGKDLRTSVKGGRSTMQVIPGPTRRGGTLVKAFLFSLGAQSICKCNGTVRDERRLLSRVLDSSFACHEVAGYKLRSVRLTASSGGGLRETGYRGRIVSFGPVLENFCLLKKQRGGDPECHTHRAALGATKPDADIQVFLGDDVPFPFESKQIRPRSVLGKARHERTECVPIERLDAILERSIGQRLGGRKSKELKHCKSK